MTYTNIPQLLFFQEDDGNATWSMLEVENLEEKCWTFYQDSEAKIDSLKHNLKTTSFHFLPN